MKTKKRKGALTLIQDMAIFIAGILVGVFLTKGFPIPAFIPADLVSPEAPSPSQSQEPAPKVGEAVLFYQDYSGTNYDCRQNEQGLYECAAR